MFNTPPKDKQPIDHAIDETFNAYDPNSEDASKIIKHLKGLHAIKAQQSPSRPSPDTVLMVAGNLLGIMMIVGAERAQVVTSKAMQFIKQAR